MTISDNFWRMRRFSLRMMAEYRAADAPFKCPMHFGLGQEMAPAILQTLMKPEDALFTHYRSHNWALAKGVPMRGMVAEFMGKATGCGGGLCGSQELTSHEHRFHSGAILAGQMAIALGAAYALKGTGHVAIGVCGDGATEEGVFYETLNLAAVHDLPILFLVEDNEWSAHTELLVRRNPSFNLNDLCDAICLPSIDVNDVDEDLPEALTEAIGHARAGESNLVRIITERACAHVGPEPDGTEGLLNDDLMRFPDMGLAVRDLDEIQDAVDFARGSEWPKGLDGMNWSGTSSKRWAGIDRIGDTGLSLGGVKLYSNAWTGPY